MQIVDEIIVEIVKCEGGYVNDFDDSGGFIKYGVIIYILCCLCGSVMIVDVKVLIVVDVVEIYKCYYFEWFKIN